MARWSLAVVAILLGVALLRAVGLDYGAPYWLESDAYTALHVDELRSGRGSNPKTANDTHYPHLIAQLTRRLPAAEPPDPANFDDPAELRAAHLAAAGRTFVQVRLIVALLSLLAIPGTWWLARRFLEPPWALFAVGLCATSLLFQCFGQQARPHAAAAALMLLSVLASMRLARRPSAANFLLAGVCAALAFGCLHSGVAVLIPLSAAYFVRRLPAGTSRARRAFDPLALLPLTCVALVVPVFYPFLLSPQQMSLNEGIDVGKHAVDFTHHRVAFDAFDGSGFATVLRTLWTWEPALGLLVALACLVWLATRGRRVPESPDRCRDRRVVLAFCVPYLLVIGAYAETYERFLLPLVPFLAVFAACGPARLWAAPSWRWWLATAAVGALAVSGFAAGRLAWLRTRPDTLARAGAWIEAHAEPGVDPVFVFPPPMDLPLGRDAASIGVRGDRPTPLFSVWSRYQARRPGAGGPAPQWSVRWIVGKPEVRKSTDPERVSSFLDEYGPGIYVMQVMTGRGPAFATLLRAELARRAERAGGEVVRFGPDPDPWSCDYPLFDQDELVEHWPNVFARILRARALGPVVEVLRVR